MSDLYRSFRANQDLIIDFCVEQQQAGTIHCHRIDLSGEAPVQLLFFNGSDWWQELKPHAL